MHTANPASITVATTVNAPVESVWQYFTLPEHITRWNQASDDWHTPKAENDLRPGGHFVYRMEARDGSFGFDFGGTYETVQPLECIAYTLGDGRKVAVRFSANAEGTTVTEVFETENTHSQQQQKSGWQQILNNFRQYVERLEQQKSPER